MLESLKNTKCAGCFESLQDKVLKNCFKLTAILNGHFLKLLYTRRLCRWFSCSSFTLRAKHDTFWSVVIRQCETSLL